MTNASYTTPEHWVKMRIPDRFKMGWKGIAQRCGWAIRKTGEPETYLVALRENYEQKLSASLRPQKILEAAQAGDAPRYEAFRWSGQDEFMDADMRNLVMGQAQRLIDRGERVPLWAAFSLLNLATADADLPTHLRAFYPMFASRLPDSSLWAITLDPAVNARRTIVRGLVAAEHAPELLARTDDEFDGFEAGRGLSSPDAIGLGAVIETALVAGAPGVLGVNTARIPGMVTLLFGHFESGREQEVAAELIDLFRPSLITQPTADSLAIPKLPPAQIEDYLKWWVAGVNRLLGIAADPSMFRKTGGSYDAASHMGFQLSLDRLFETIRGILVGSRRDDYTRLILAFQAMDLLIGMRLGSYDTLAHPGRVRAIVKDLETKLPSGAASVVLPRCRRAADALEQLKSGFYLTERIDSGRLRVQTKKGGWDAIALDTAVAEYVNLIRDASHTLREKMASPGDLSLFVSHDGDVDPSVADVPFVHLVNMLANPTALEIRLRPPTRLS